MRNSFLFYSIIIPIYNKAGTIVRALSSILQQSFKDYEIILCFDGCTDNSEDIARKTLKGSGAKFKIINSEVNRGAGMARNAGIDAACGLYLMFLDADDQFYNKYVLARMYEHILENNGPALVRSRFIWRENINGKNTEKYCDTVNMSSMSGNAYLREMIIENEIYCPPLKLMEDTAFNMIVWCFAVIHTFFNEITFIYNIGHNPRSRKDLEKEYRPLMEDYIKDFHSGYRLKHNIQGVRE